MDEEKARFLFGAVPDERPATEDEVRELLEADRPRTPAPELALRAIIAIQVLDGEPAAAWRAAQRMLDERLSRTAAMDQLVDTIGPVVVDALRHDEGFDADAYAAALDRLPLPSLAEVAAAYVEVARQHGPIAFEDLAERVEALLHLDPEDAERLVDEAEQLLQEDPSSPVSMIPPDVIVHVPAMVAGSVLSHRLTADEQADARLDLDADLAALACTPQPHVDGVPLDLDGADDDGGRAWIGDGAWLAELPAGTLLAVRVDEDGEVTVTPLTDEPAVDPALVAQLRAVYDAEIEEAGLPVSAEDLVLGVLARDRSAFDRPRLPVTEMAAAAGLDRRGGVFAHDAELWLRVETVGRGFRLSARVGPHRLTAALEACDLLADAHAAPAALRDALEIMGDPEVLVAVVEELAGDESPERVAALVDAGDRLLAASGSGYRGSVAGWVAAVAAERDGRVLDAESHLRAASRAGRGWSFVEDRLAWYEFDRGDAAAAYGRWSELDPPAADPDVAMARRFAAASPVGPEPGRNSPCWCGSGRKFKQCHRGRPAARPLPERVPWLCRKAVAYLGHRGGTEDDLYRYAECRHPEPEEALADPLTLDVVLHEGGWFDRFLSERGPLLPDDEALLAASWTLVERTVYEFVEVDAGVGVAVRDLRTGDRVEVTERTLSGRVEPGWMVCSRAVPDGGGGHQFVGGAFGVPPGREREVLEILEARDGEGLLSWVAATEQVPRLVSTDGDDLVNCVAVLRVSATAAEVLDSRYEPTDPGWIWTSDGDEDDEPRILAALTLDGDRLTVHTLTAARMDRALADLAVAFPGCAVLSDERVPADLDVPGPVAPRTPDAQALDPAVVAELQERYEARWCDEPVPALDGRTPRAAAADPTRRDELRRLIASFPEIDPAPGAFGLRPARLRELLELD